MGVVYRALDPVLKRRVAIKVMSDAFAQNDDLRERFLREAQAAGSLQHPNVITIYDFGEVDGHLYIAMEFVEGQDVAELLAHEVPLSVAHKVDIAIGVLQGLAFAHKRGIVHRDIKPANIRVDADGNARIMDFGVAHLASSEMTRTGVVIGTPSYMAPEQILGGKVGPEADIFSVGAVLYELLTGTRPFAGGPLQAVMYRVLSEPPMPLDVAVPGLPARLNDIVMRALAKEPEKRYLSALAMANDLLSVRASLEGGTSSPGTVSLRATIESALDERRTSQFKRVRRRRVAFSGVGIAAAAVLVLSGWFLARRSLTAPNAAPAARLAGSVGSPAGESVRAVPLDPPPAQAPPSQSSAQPQSDVLRPAPTTRNDQRASSSGATAAERRAQERPAPPKPPGSSVSPQPPNVAPASTTQPTVNPPANGGAASGAVPPSATSSSAPAVNAAPPNSTAVRSNPSTSSAPNAGAPNATSANAAAEIGNAIDAYARAIESRDMNQLRRAYSTITGDQASAFADFFSSTRALRAVLVVKSVQVDGNKATAHVAGTYEFTTTAGRTQQQAVTFQAELRHDGGSWKLVAVR